MAHTMNEAKQTLKTLEQRYRLLQQQQATFINALERTRENANDRVRGVRNLQQVRNYLDNFCNNSTDKRILSHFLDTCTQLSNLCLILAALESETTSARGIIEETTNLLRATNDLSALRAKYPHDVLNHLSCDEAKNFYGGVVSLIPIVLDNIREAVSRMESSQLQSYNMGNAAGQINKRPSATKPGYCSDKLSTGVQTRVSQGDSSLQINKTNGYIDSFKPAWRPPGRSYTT